MNDSFMNSYHEYKPKEIKSRDRSGLMKQSTESVDWESLAHQKDCSIEEVQELFAESFIKAASAEMHFPAGEAAKGIGGTLTSTLGLATAGTFAGLGLYELGRKIYEGIHSRVKENAVLKHLKSLYPEEQSGMVEEAYHALLTVSPKIAADPLLARSVLKSMMTMMVHPQHSSDAPITDLNSLAQVADIHSKSRSNDTSLLGYLAQTAKDITSIDDFTGMYSNPKIRNRHRSGGKGL